MNEWKAWARVPKAQARGCASFHFTSLESFHSGEAELSAFAKFVHPGTCLYLTCCSIEVNGQCFGERFGYYPIGSTVDVAKVLIDVEKMSHSRMTVSLNYLSIYIVWLIVKSGVF